MRNIFVSIFLLLPFAANAQYAKPFENWLKKFRTNSLAVPFLSTSAMNTDSIAVTADYTAYRVGNTVTDQRFYLPATTDVPAGQIFYFERSTPVVTGSGPGQVEGKKVYLLHNALEPGAFPERYHDTIFLSDKDQSVTVFNNSNGTWTVCASSGDLSLYANVRNVAGDYEIKPNDYTVNISNQAEATITLPSAQDQIGRVLYIKHGSASKVNVVAPFGSYVENVQYLTMQAKGAVMGIQSNGAQWLLLTPLPIIYNYDS